MIEESQDMRLTRQELLRRGLVVGVSFGMTPAVAAALRSGTASAAVEAATAGTIPRSAASLAGRARRHTSAYRRIPRGEPRFW